MNLETNVQANIDLKIAMIPDESMSLSEAAASLREQGYKVVGVEGRKLIVEKNGS